MTAPQRRSAGARLSLAARLRFAAFHRFAAAFRIAAALGLALGAAAIVPALADEVVAAAAPGRIAFVARTRMADAEGEFRRWSFTGLHIDPADPAASWVEVNVDVASVDTGIGRRDAHLRRDDFFDVEKFPTATVRVQDVQPDGTAENGLGRYRATFVVKLHGVEQSLPGRFEITSLSPPSVRGELEIDRVVFGVGAPPSRWSPFAIDERIPITFEAVVPVDPATGRSTLGS